MQQPEISIHPLIGRLRFSRGIRLASLEKPSVFLGHGLRPMTSNEKKLRLMQAWAKLFIFDVAWLMAIA